MQILHLDSSILGEASASRRLGAAITSEIARRRPEAVIVHRDLAVDPIPHLDGHIAAGFRDADGRRFSADIVAEHARSEALVTEFLASGIIVVDAPMYNFSIPTQLKAWLDRIAQVGRTFRYTEQGPVGLSGGRRVIVASARGGLYSEGPASTMDFQESYLRAFFRFLGIDAVHVVRAEQQSRGPELGDRALSDAHAAIPAVVSQALAA